MHYSFFDLQLQFWQKHPALLNGLSCLTATACALAWHPVYAIVFFALFHPFFFKRTFQPPVLYAVLATLLAFGTCILRTSHPALPREKIAGEGHFHIESLSIVNSPFSRSYMYKGILKHFRSEEGVDYAHLPCSIFVCLKNPLPAHRDYHVQGCLTQKKEHLFCLKPKRWKEIEGTFSLAQWRYDAKKKLTRYIQQHIPDRAAGSFLAALVTGDCEERSLRLEFGRLGLQHLLAISGFHFSFFALALHILLRPFFSFGLRTGILMGALAAYFVFLGNAPSILRAFTAIYILLIGQVCKRRASGLNALGAALTLEVFWDPLSITGLSFQLSFLCTLALLLFYPLMHHLYCYVLPQRASWEVRDMPLLDQHGYLLSIYIRKSLSINTAILVFALPALLHLFHKFPLLSILYNLFFPACVAISLCLLCLGLLFPFIGTFFHGINAYWTSCLLHLTSDPPAYFDIAIRTKAISFPWVICYLVIAFYIGIRSSSRIKSF
jgi:competence protein ComEC